MGRFKISLSAEATVEGVEREEIEALATAVARMLEAFPPMPGMVAKVRVEEIP